MDCRGLCGGAVVTARLEAAVEAHAVELRRLTDENKALREALAAIAELPARVQALADRLELASQWAVRVDQTLDEYGGELDYQHGIFVDLCEWHGPIADALPSFRKRHPFDPIEAGARRAEAAARAAEFSGEPVAGPFSGESRASLHGFDLAAIANDHDGAEHDRQPG